MNGRDYEYMDPRERARWEDADERIPDYVSELDDDDIDEAEREEWERFYMSIQPQTKPGLDCASVIVLSVMWTGAAAWGIAYLLS